MNIMDIVIPGINFWFLIALLLMSFICGLVVAFRMSATRGYYRGDYR